MKLSPPKDHRPVERLSPQIRVDVCLGHDACCLLYIGPPIFAKQPLVHVSLVARGSPLLILGLFWTRSLTPKQTVEDEATGGMMYVSFEKSV